MRNVDEPQSGDAGAPPPDGTQVVEAAGATSSRPARPYFLRPLAAVGIMLACYVALQVLAVVFFALLGLGYTLLPSFALAVVLPVFLVTRAHSPSVRVTLRLFPVRPAALVFCVGASFSFILLQYNVAGLLERLFPMPAWIQDFLLDMTRITNLRELLRVASGVVFAAAFAEELLFRGFLQGSLEHKLGRWRGVLLTSILFAVLHDPWRLIPVFFIGLLLGYLASRGGSIYYAMVAHAVTNSTSVAGRNIFGMETDAEFSVPFALVPVAAVVFAVSVYGFIRTTRSEMKPPLSPLVESGEPEGLRASEESHLPTAE